jgi:chitinase
VDFWTTNVTAVGDSDYTATNGTLIFAPGEASKTITLDILGDDIHESNETFRVHLVNPLDATLTVRTNTITIIDDDVSSVNFVFTTTNVTEAGTNFTVTLTVERAGATNTAVSVDYATTNVTASAGSDYTAASGTLSFAAGETTKTFNLTILGEDTMDATNETFRVRLLSAVNTAVGTNATNTVTITDDDSSSVRFVVSALIINELSPTNTISVRRLGATNTQVTVRYTTANGSATAGTDYLAATGLLVFAPGETNQTFELVVLNNAAIEIPETLTIRLQSPTNTILSTPTNMLVTITDAFGGIDGRNLFIIENLWLTDVGNVCVRVIGPTNALMRLQATANFLDWEDLIIDRLSGPMPDNPLMGELMWCEPAHPTASLRLYRVLKP